MNTRSFLTRVAAISGIAVGAFAFVAMAGTWTPPAGAPPTNNVPFPINVGPNTDASGNPLTQVKSDALVVQGLLGLSSLQFNPGGLSNIVPGSTLTASDNKGDAQWTAPGAAATECNGSDGYMYSRTNAYIDDWDNVAAGDFLEFYCRNHTVRICLSGDHAGCPWYTSITSDDAHTCGYSAGRLKSGVGTNSWAEWKAAPASLCSGQSPCTTATNFNVSPTVMAYAAGVNTWYLCSAAKQKSIITSY